MEGVISQKEYKKFWLKMFPAKVLEAEATKLLKLELDSDFYVDPKDPDNDEEILDENNPHKNFLKFSKQVGGFQWINALHQFEGDECLHTPLTYALVADPSGAHRNVSLLTHFGADPNLRDSLGRPPLYHALQHGIMRLTTIDVLLEAGANPLAMYAGKSIAQHSQQMNRATKGKDRFYRGAWAAIEAKLE